MNSEQYDLPDAVLLNTTRDYEFLVWRPDREYVILGQSNDPENSLHLDRVLSDHVRIVKRPSGGEAVILNRDMLVISLVLKQKKLPGSKEMFRIMNTFFSKFLRTEIGIKAEYRGISDLVISDLKILGSSIYRKPGLLFYHAVLNLGGSSGQMERYLKHPAREPDYRMGRNHRQFVTSISDHVKNLDPDRFRQNLEQKLSSMNINLPT